MGHRQYLKRLWPARELRKDTDSQSSREKMDFSAVIGDPREKCELRPLSHTI